MLRLDNEKILKKSSEMDRFGKRKLGRLKGRWKRIIEIGMKSMRYIWNNIIRIFNNRSEWRDFVVVFCLEMYEEDE